jgi:hypothetical protein
MCEGAPMAQTIGALHTSPRGLDEGDYLRTTNRPARRRPPTSSR